MSKLSKKRKKPGAGGSVSARGSKLPWKRKSKNEARAILPHKELTPDEISAYKREMGRVIEYANFQIDDAIRDNNVSTELNRFLQGDSSKRFNIDSLNNPGDLRAYMTNVDVVIKSLAPFSRKGEIDSALAEAEAYRGQFGNQWRSAYVDSEESTTKYRHYNLVPVFDEEGKVIRRAVNPALAQKAFKAYRRLEEEYAGYIGRQGQELMFGSENLIILLYDFYEKNSGADNDFQTTGMTDDALAAISPMLSNWINQQLLEMERANFSSNKALKIISDWDEFLNKRYF